MTTPDLAAARPAPPLSLRAGARPLSGVLAGNLAVGTGYYLLAKLGGAVQFTGGVQVAWLPVGFAIAMLYLGDLRWFAGATLADLLLGTGIVPFHAGMLTDPANWVPTLGNTAEFTVAALILRHRIGGGTRLDRLSDLAWLLVAVAVGAAISATVGTLTQWRSGGIEAHDIPTVLRTWWLGDASGALLIAPLVLVWAPPLPAWRPTARSALEAVAILGAVVALSVVIFGSTHPLTYIVFPALMLAALDLGQRGATVAIALAVTIAIVRTAHDAGPFVTRSIDDETLRTQLYILISAVATLTLGALAGARRAAAVELADARRREAERAAEERRRIAGELHDSVSQTLFTLGLHAGIARHHVARAELPQDSPLRTAVGEVAQLAHDALVELRASIFELRGDALAQQGLVAALRAHAAAVAVRRPVRVEVEGPDERLPLAPEAEEELYRAAQAAITGAVRRADAPAAIGVEVSAGPREVRVVVRGAAEPLTLTAPRPQ